MAVKFTKPELNLREKISELDKPSGIAGRAMLAADTPQEQFDLIGAGRRNLIINGGFDVWQRGTTGSLVGGPDYVSADRWKIYVNTSTTISLTRQSFTTGQTEVPGNPKYYGRFDWLGTATSQFFGFEQLIEGVHHGAGDFLTVSFYARTQYGDDMVLGINQKFGTGGSADTALGNFDLIMETSWKKFVLTIPVPSIRGKTIGDLNCLSCTWFRTGTLNSYLDIANVQIELGKVATPFEQRSYGEELALCQRYYYRIGSGSSSDILGVGGNFGTTTAYFSGTYPVEMRTTPTITVNDPAYFRCHTPNGSSLITTAFGATSENTNKMWFLNFTLPSSQPAGAANLCFTGNNGSGYGIVSMKAEL